METKVYKLNNTELFHQAICTDNEICWRADKIISGLTELKDNDYSIQSISIYFKTDNGKYAPMWGDNWDYWPEIEDREDWNNFVKRSFNIYIKDIISLGISKTVDIEFIADLFYTIFPDPHNNWTDRRYLIESLTEELKDKNLSEMYFGVFALTENEYWDFKQGLSQLERDFNEDKKQSADQ